MAEKLKLKIKNFFKKEEGQVLKSVNDMNVNRKLFSVLFLLLLFEQPEG